MEGNTDPERVAEQDAGGLQCVGKREHGAVHDPTVYERDILPKIQGMSVRRLVALTGLSEYYLPGPRCPSSTAAPGVLPARRLPTQ